MYYGIYFLAAQLIEVGNNCEAFDLNPVEDLGWYCNDQCGIYPWSTYRDLLVISLSEIVGR